MKILVPLKAQLVPGMAMAGIRLAKTMGAELSFLNVADTRPFRGYIKVLEEAVDLFRKGGEEALKEAVELADKEGVKAESAIVEGYPCEEILKASKDADLTVLGIRHFSSEETIGSVTKNVLVSSTKPVFVVGDDQEEFDNVLVAIDGSKYSKKALEYALDYAKLLGLSGISAVFVASSPDRVGTGHEVLKEASEISEKSNVKLDTHLKEGDPASEIVELSEKFNVIVMSATGKGTISRFFLGSVSSEVAVFSRCGIIIVPHRE
jgi:nucleotide-binding universal stress UspA family protein